MFSFCNIIIVSYKFTTNSVLSYLNFIAMISKFFFIASKEVVC
uniref:Uncharacterized protein n=1 Tax=virus sp. ctrcb4 TaxID=2825824 RepID=A0A8S5RPR5_9VIRU|nr:MAG TPA: hypothetical protein [virus sp. ctrcb4]DAR12590.1 MAG TPA: hypothetical protein [Crassvirales sp.]